jgi:hypothetical protein
VVITLFKKVLCGTDEWFDVEAPTFEYWYELDADDSRDTAFDEFLHQYDIVNDISGHVGVVGDVTFLTQQGYITFCLRWL